MAINIFSILLLSIISSYSIVSIQSHFDLHRFFLETEHFFTAPLHWDGSDLIVFGSLIATTMVAAIFEVSSKNKVFDITTRPLYNSFPATVGKYYGKIWLPVIFVACYGSYSLITGDLTTRKIAYEIGLSCLYVGVIVFILKNTIGRSRPFMGEGKSSFRPFLFFYGYNHHSFPSGDVTQAFVMSTIFAFHAGPLWLKVLAYLPAAFTTFSRVYKGYHWISDCIFGAGIGFIAAKWVFRY